MLLTVLLLLITLYVALSAVALIISASVNTPSGFAESRFWFWNTFYGKKFLEWGRFPDDPDSPKGIVVILALLLPTVGLLIWSMIAVYDFVSSETAVHNLQFVGLLIAALYAMANVFVYVVQKDDDADADWYDSRFWLVNLRSVATAVADAPYPPDAQEPAAAPEPSFWTPQRKQVAGFLGVFLVVILVCWLLVSLVSNSPQSALMHAQVLTNTPQVQPATEIPTETAVPQVSSPTPELPTEVPATATSVPTLVPTIPPTVESMFSAPAGKGCMGDQWFASGEFSGAVPCALKATRTSTMAGVVTKLPGGFEVGSDKGWNQPVEVSDTWTSHICGATVLCIKAGESVDISVRFDAVYLDLGDIYTPYISLLNAQLTKSNDEQAYTLLAEGVSISANGHNIPFTTSYDGVLAGSGTSSEIVLGSWITWSFHCTADIDCQYGIGQYGKLTNYITGESTAEMQTIGGDNNAPEIMAPNYDGILPWIAAHSN